MDYLRKLRENARIMLYIWQPATITDIFDDANGDRQWRTRKPHEYPENRAVDWDSLAAWAGNEANALIQLRNFALDRAAQVRNGEHW